ncbi:TIGR00341 family protein [Halalkalirubrum salinum]|uniref:TIGR00341 family protein n=1 Tax=Halalkalirubrum salinum TaxID=2563889 RepID=UPI0010FB09B9|nr:TIGR00341 family protein [Halalkalirubrum salinum]
MRVIQTLVPTGKHDVVVNTLTTESIDFAMTEETSDSAYSDVVYIPVDGDEVERIVELLRDVGIERDGYMVVSEAETIVSDRFEAQSEATGEPNGERISRDELRTKARNLSRSTPNYVALTVISAVVAAAGLLQNSASVVVGSMVIAPLIGPAMASCVGTVINDDDLFWEGIRSQAVGLAVALVSATLFAFAYRYFLAPELELLLIQQVAERAHPGLLALAIAIGAGTAGALSLTSGADEALVGVMIAVALMPPTASVGLGIAYAEPALAFGAGVLVLVNLLSINAAGIATIWIKRYRPSHWYDVRRARRVTLERLVTFGLAILLLTSFLAVSSIDARENAAFESTMQETIDRETEGDIIAVDYTYRADLVSQTPTGVTIHVRTDRRPDELAESIATAVEADTGRSIEVTVVTADAATRSSDN